MVKIRLSRGGSKKRPFYHIVATDSRSSRDGKYIERIGFYNPTAKKNEEDIRVDLERLSYWQSVGAQVSDRVKKLINLIDLSRDERELKNVSKLRKRKAKQEEKKLKETPAEETPAEEAAEETPAEEAAEETPAEEAAEETPAEETPAEEAAEETPAEETPAEEAAEETPAEEAAEEESEEKKNKDDSS